MSDAAVLQPAASPILVLVPTAEEQSHLLSAFVEGGARIEQSTHGRLATWDVSPLNVVVAPGGLGKVQFAVQTQHLLDTREWRLVLCVGSAGALSDDLAIGDVVIASETVEHDIKKIARRLMPRFATASSVWDRCRSALPADVRVHVGAIASGDEDIVDADRRSDLRRDTGAIAVAWEGAGAARACLFSDVDFMEVRAIADAANADGPRDFAQYLAMAMRNVALVVRCIAAMPQSQG